MQPESNDQTSADVKLGIWGAPGSGKTTLLAALRAATLDDDTGSWLLVGRDAGARRFLRDYRRLLTGREFPEATEDPNEYRFWLSGNPAPTLFNQIQKMLGKTLSPKIEFDLEVRDYPGGFFDEEWVGSSQQDELCEFLTACNGLIYVFDPVLEAEHPDANRKYLEAILDEVFAKIQDEGRLYASRLPHFVAVCLAKYDHPRAFSRLLDEGLIEADAGDEHQVPIVTDEDRAFELLADRELSKLIERFFSPDRVRRFALSSIGFFRNPEDRVDLDDYSNFQLSDGREILRGKSYPVNVLPPFIWLESEIRLSRRSK
jgi:hypothetical protein